MLIGALGVVFGDIGTSPLYALQAMFGISHIDFTSRDVIGAVSLIIWAITLVVTIKYVGLMLKADNNGEGGIMALISLMKRTNISSRKKTLFIVLGLIGASLFYGDSVITPAISVLSAVGGVQLIVPEFNSYVIPVTVFVLTLLFIAQSKGVGAIGALFGPIMITWFTVSAIGGFSKIIEYPPVLQALLPTTAINFYIIHPIIGFIAMGAVILAITGAEALYADMGQFGRSSVSRVWLWFVFPALILTYLGQGALIILQPEAIKGAYFLMYPEQMRLPIVILATIATLIASQAALTGAFSLTRQAIQLGFAPRLSIRHTSSNSAGQIYIPFLNWLLAILVLITVIVFGSATNLAGAYGFAVCGALAIDTIFLLLIMRHLWHRPLFFITLCGVIFITIDTLFISSSVSKLLRGAWLPVLIALASYVLLSTWYKGHRYISRERARIEGPLSHLVHQIRYSKVHRTQGFAVYIGHHPGNAPLALHETVEQLHELHEKIVVVTVNTSDRPHLPEHQRIIYDGLGSPNDGISHVTLMFGYKDTPNVPHTLEYARELSKEIDFDPHKAIYFTSLSQPFIAKNHRMATWRKKLYIFMDRNANNPTTYFRLPIERTIEMRSLLEL